MNFDVNVRRAALVTDRRRQGKSVRALPARRWLCAIVGRSSRVRRRVSGGASHGPTRTICKTATETGALQPNSHAHLFADDHFERRWRMTGARRHAMPWPAIKAGWGARRCRAHGSYGFRSFAPLVSCVRICRGCPGRASCLRCDRLRVPRRDPGDGRRGRRRRPAALKSGHRAFAFAGVPQTAAAMALVPAADAYDLDRK